MFSNSCLTKIISIYILIRKMPDNDLEIFKSIESDRYN